MPIYVYMGYAVAQLFYSRIIETAVFRVYKDRLAAANEFAFIIQ